MTTSLPTPVRDDRDTNLLEVTAVADAGPTFMRAEADLLIEAARATTSPANLRTMVGRFATLALEATDAYRATVFLLDSESGSLQLWAVSSRDPKREMWMRGLELGSISLDEVPLRRALLEAGSPLAIPDARASELVPDEWCDTFDLGAVVVAPLLAAGEPLGALVVDWHEPRQVPSHVIDVIDAIAGSLALPVHNVALAAREAERAAALQALLRATTVLQSTAGLEELADRLTEPLARALGARGVAICLIEDDIDYRTLASSNPFFPDRGSLEDLAGRSLVGRIARTWELDPVPVLIAEEDVAQLRLTRPPGRLLVLPLAATDATMLGFVVVDLHEREPTAPAVELAGALSSHLAAAIERARLYEDLTLETERLRGLCALWGFGSEALEAFAAAVEDAVGPALGFTLVRVTVIDEGLRELAALASADDADRALLSRWERAGAAQPLLTPQGELAAPLVVRGSLAGVVRAQARAGVFSDRQAEMLGALAAAFGQALEREADRRSAAARELDLAMAEERERVADRLHNTVGRLLYTLNLRAGTLRLVAEESAFADDIRQIEDLARSGLAGVRKAVAALASLREEGQGLMRSIERLAAEYRQNDEDLAVHLDVEGDDSALPPATAEALVQVAGEGLANVERHAGARNVTISLDVTGVDAVLRVRDDGHGLGRSDARPGSGVGLQLARRSVETLGGSIELRDHAPGAELVARVPIAAAVLELSR